MPLARIIVSSLLALVIFAAAAVSNVFAQGMPTAPTGVTAVVGANVGETIVTWDPVPGADFYRVGWLALSDYNRVAEELGEEKWWEAVTIQDVMNRGQSSHAIVRLSPGETYHFVVGSAAERHGTAQWSQWSEPFTPRGQARACPSLIGADPDRTVLALLYYAAHGANWSESDNWLSDAPLGKWHGVSTDGDGRVAGINLPNHGLDGWIPSELGNLANLQILNLSANQLSGEMPPARLCAFLEK